MAVEPKKRTPAADSAAETPPAEAAAKPAAAQSPVQFAPIYIKAKGRRKKRKKKYTRGTRGLQRLTFVGLPKGASRVGDSVVEALNVFGKRSNKSARKKRDGAIRYSLRNASKGFSKGLRQLGKAPAEITDRIGTRRVLNTFRFFG